jgi:hypothetical protein
MARQLRSETVIHAPAEVVWDILTDFESFPSWNPFIRKASGRLAPGERIEVWLRLYGRRTMRFTPKVTVADRPSRLGWWAQSGIRGILDADRFFVIEPAGDGVIFRQGEDCSGVIAPIALKLGLESRILQGYERLNHALKARAERATASHDAPSS